MTNTQRNILAVLSLAACFLNLPLAAFLFTYGAWVSILFIFHIVLLGGCYVMFLYLYEDELLGVRHTTSFNAFTIAFVSTSSAPLFLASLFPIYLQSDVLLGVAEGLMGVHVYMIYEGGFFTYVLIVILIYAYGYAVKWVGLSIVRYADRNLRPFRLGFITAVVVHACWLFYAFILLVSISEPY